MTLFKIRCSRLGLKFWLQINISGKIFLWVLHNVSQICISIFTRSEKLQLALCAWNLIWWVFLLSLSHKIHPIPTRLVTTHMIDWNVFVYWFIRSYVWGELFLTSWISTVLNFKDWKLEHEKFFLNNILMISIL